VAARAVLSASSSIVIAPLSSALTICCNSSNAFSYVKFSISIQLYLLTRHPVGAYGVRHHWSPLFLTAQCYHFLRLMQNRVVR